MEMKLNDNKNSTEFKSGFVAIVGEANAGKSTLLNTLLQKKVSIVSPIKNTTRNQIQGIYNDETSQIVFLDTPGWLPPKTLLAQKMQSNLSNSLKDVEIVLYLIPYNRGLSNDFLKLFASLSPKTKIILIINKIDQLKDHQVLIDFINYAKNAFNWDEIIPLSARREKDSKYLLNLLKSKLINDIAYFDRDVTDVLDEQFVISEIIREQIFNLLYQEVPQDVMVKVTGINKKSDSWKISADIVTARTSTKKIIIGHDGAMIKQIGSRARGELESRYNKTIHLFLFLKIRKNWKNQENFF